MNWKFWKKEADGQVNGGGQAKKLYRPKQISQEVGRFLVVDLHEDPDWVWDLKTVERPRDQDDHVRDIRIFDPHRVGTTKISDYDALDSHPELVLFEGWFDKKTRKVGLEKKQAPGEMENAA